MSEPTSLTGKRERSPAFPYIGLGKALERAKVVFEKAKRYEVRITDIASDWGLQPTSSSTVRNVAALLAFGLIEDSGSEESRKIKLTEVALRILEDKRPGVKEALLAECAIKPKTIAEYALLWSKGRPDDAHCLSHLKFEGGFTEEGAKLFLRVFDETMPYAITLKADNDSPKQERVEEEIGNLAEKPKKVEETLITPSGVSANLTSGQTERAWLSGPLSKELRYRILVSGEIGPKEIGKLIKILEAQKAILTDEDI